MRAFHIISSVVLVVVAAGLGHVLIDQPRAAAAAGMPGSPRYQLSCVADGYEPGAICYRLDMATGEVVRVDDGAAPFPAKTDSFGVIYGR